MFHFEKILRISSGIQILKLLCRRNVRNPGNFLHTVLFFIDSCQFGEHVRPMWAVVRLWLKANTGVTRELAPAGWLAGWRGSISRTASAPGFLLFDWRSGIESTLATGRVQVFFSDPVSRIHAQLLKNSERESDRENGRARVTVGQRTRTSTILSHGGGRCERRKRRTGTLSSLSSRSPRAHLFSYDRYRGRDTALRRSVHRRDFSRISRPFAFPRAFALLPPSDPAAYSATLQFTSDFWKDVVANPRGKFLSRQI